MYTHTHTYMQWNIIQFLKKERNHDIETTWINLEDIMLSEISQTERQILHDLTYMCNLKKLNSQKQRLKWCLPAVSTL